MESPTRVSSAAARSSLVAMLAIVIAGCSGTPEPSGPHLRTVDRPSDNCFGVGLDPVHLEGDPTDPRVAWLENAGHRRFETVWPLGYTARFAPRLEVLDSSGTVVYHAGDPVDSYCATADSEVVLVWPPRPDQ